MSAEKKDEEMTFMDYFKQCDVFPKTVDDVKVETPCCPPHSACQVLTCCFLFARK